MCLIEPLRNYDTMIKTHTGAYFPAGNGRARENAGHRRPRSIIAGSCTDTARSEIKGVISSGIIRPDRDGLFLSSSADAADSEDGNVLCGYGPP